jgi:hypothetical protein
MFAQVLKNGMLAALMAFSFSLVGWTSTSAIAQHSCCAGHSHSTAGPGHGHAQHGTATSEPAKQPAPHGGQITTLPDGACEVVYQPKETRVYLYEKSGQPISAKGVEGEITLRVHGNDQLLRYPLRYIAPPGGSEGHDYLAVAVDVSQIRDGDMEARFQLLNLPFQRRQTTFVQTFALSKSRPQVTQAALAQADRPGIAQQKTCPVMGAALGSMGDPIKLLVGNQPVYLCCKGCVGKVRQNPDYYLNLAVQLRQAR